MELHHSPQLRLTKCQIIYAQPLTLDFWNSREACEQFMAAHKNRYKMLDAAGEELTSQERRIGWYELVGP